MNYEFIWNIQAAENASIRDHNPRGVTDVNTCGNKSLEIGVKGVGGAILTRFTLIDPSYHTERNNLSLTIVRNSTSRVEVSASP